MGSRRVMESAFIGVHRRPSILLALMGVRWFWKAMLAADERR
jgi:hypothetical protein